MAIQRFGRGNPTLPPTPRDREILKGVVKHGQMTRQQIQRLHFRKDGKLASIQAVCRRLRILTERGYLSRVRLPVTRGSGPYVYWPGRGAIVVLDKEDSARARRIVKRNRMKSFSSLSHGLEIVEFYIGLKEALESKGGEIVVWLGEWEARYQFEWGGHRLTLTPDGYCLWAVSGKEGAFFLEWDRGTESMRRFSQKMTRYEAYYRVRAYRNHLGEMGLKPRLLIVAPDDRREKKLADWIGRRLDRDEFGSLPTILVAVRDLVFLDILGRIWRKAADEQRIRLVD